MDGIMEGDYKAAKMTVGRWSEAPLHELKAFARERLCVHEHVYASEPSSPVMRTHLDQRNVNAAILPRGSKALCAPPFVCALVTP
jgi:hypothetical protein